MTSNVDLPIPVPVPDVPGADAGYEGLPDRSDLTALQRLTVDASAVADIGLRTAIASLVGASMLPTVAKSIVRRSDLHRERSNLEFYAELAARRDPVASFPAPTDVPAVTTRPANPVAQYIAHGNVENLRFESSFVPVNPDMRKQWTRLERNNVVWAQHWRHDDGPRPTLCVIHGFMGSPYLFNGLFFSLPWFYRTGYDVLLCAAVPRPPRRKRLALQRIRLLLPRHGRIRRDHGPGGPRLPVGRELVTRHWSRPHRAHRNVVGRLHLSAGGLG